MPRTNRYHATAVECGEHLMRCLFYIDMNMIRAGVVNHPSKWIHSGYGEIQQPPLRYRLIDREKLIGLCGMHNDQQSVGYHKDWIELAVNE